MLAAWYRINTPNVVHEVIEGEAVIVNLATGLYYSVDRSGVDIWTLLEQELAVADIVATLAERYTDQRATIEATVQKFLALLEAETLIIPQSGPAPAARPVPPLPEGAYLPRFEPPTLQKYSDMEDLLLLDPLHTLGQSEG